MERHPVGASRVHLLVSEDGPLTGAGWAAGFRRLAAGTAAMPDLLGYATQRAVADGLGRTGEALSGHIFVLNSGEADPAAFLSPQWSLHGLDRA